MANNTVQSNIVFPRLMMNQPGMFMPLENPIQVKRGVPESPPAIKEPELPPPPKNKDNYKYWLGAACVAASAIAGIVMYNGRLRETSVQRIIEDDEPITHYSFKLVEHAKDKVLEIFNKCPELGLENKVETTYQKRVRVDENGKSILKKAEKMFVDRGLKRCDTLSRPAGTAQTTFVQDDGKVRALIDWDSDGNLYRYWIKDENGHIIRDYNYTEEGISSKYYYTKGGIRIKEVHYNEDGWTFERNYDREGFFVNEHEIKPELKLKANEPEE